MFGVTQKAEPAKKLTREEVAALARAIQDTAPQTYSDAIYDDIGVLAEVGWTQGRALLDLSTGFDVVPKATLAKLRDDANQYESKLDINEKDTLRAVLQKAFEEGASVDQTRDMLRVNFAEGVHYTDDNGDVVQTIATKDWAETVARTELSAAANAGMMDLYDEAGIQRLEWLAANSPDTCNDCADTDGEVVNIGDNFPNVDVPNPPGHPRCVCTTAPADEDIGTFRGSREQQDNAARGGYSASDYEAKFGFEHPLDSRKEKAFNPDQPRDDHGMWTSGGGDSPTNPGEGSPSDPASALRPTTDYGSFRQMLANSQHGEFLTQHSDEEYAKGHTYLDPTGKAGYFVTEHGDFANLVNESGVRGLGLAALKSAVANGQAKTLDAFDPLLPKIYAQAGMVETGRMKFNSEYAPAGWKPENDSPDVVFMAAGARQSNAPHYYSGDQWDAAKGDSLAAWKTAHR